jgi:hypothetical protein
MVLDIIHLWNVFRSPARGGPHLFFFRVHCRVLPCGDFLNYFGPHLAAPQLLSFSLRIPERRRVKWREELLERREEEDSSSIEELRV